MPCSEKSFSSRSITDSVTSPFQTKNGRVLNSAGGLGNSVLRRARESTVAVVATDTKISARTKLFLIEVSLSHAGKEGLLFGLTISANSHGLNAQQCAELFDLACDMAHSDRAVVRSPLGVPIVDEPPRPDAEPVPAVRVADLQDRAGNRIRLRGQQFQLSAAFHHREQRHRTELHRHLHRKPSAYLAVVDLERPDFDPAFRDRQVPRTVVAHQIGR